MKKLLILFLPILLMSQQCSYTHSGDRTIKNKEGDTAKIMKSNQIDFYSFEKEGARPVIDSIFFFVDTIGSHTYHFVSNGYNIVSHTHNPDCSCLKSEWENNTY